MRLRVSSVDAEVSAQVALRSSAVERACDPDPGIQPDLMGVYPDQARPGITSTCTIRRRPVPWLDSCSENGLCADDTWNVRYFRSGGPG